MINVAVIGCSAIAKSRHIPNILRCENTNLYGLYNRTYERTVEFAITYGGKVFTDLDELFADQEVDAVVITTASATHAVPISQ
jgi:UDP-N-acetylglucosamine 3-dehydrogenase